ncbi:hypothetical protein [Actinomyces radicidentis]|uniref:hypothetical protein n=1 Tax=Actinomyces radicidentis TaxID=111015 RepID=UPI0012373374|nr:hypothetical protein [Actinomyces radicidentis]
MPDILPVLTRHHNRSRRPPGDLLAPGADAATVLVLGSAGFALVAALIAVDEVLRRRGTTTVSASTR